MFVPLGIQVRLNYDFHIDFSLPLPSQAVRIADESSGFNPKLYLKGVDSAMILRNCHADFSGPLSDFMCNHVILKKLGSQLNILLTFSGERCISWGLRNWTVSRYFNLAVYSFKSYQTIAILFWMFIFIPDPNNNISKEKHKY